MCREPASDLRMFVGRIVVDDDVNVELPGNVLLDVFEELKIFLVPMSLLALGEHFSVGDVQCGKQGCRPVALIVAVTPSTYPRPIGNMGCVRSRAWIWLFSSAHKTTAFSGGLRYSPTISRTFSTKNGSVESLKCRWRWGWSPKARQIRCTVW